MYRLKFADILTEINQKCVFTMCETSSFAQLDYTQDLIQK